MIKFMKLKRVHINLIIILIIYIASIKIYNVRKVECIHSRNHIINNNINFQSGKGNRLFFLVNKKNIFKGINNISYKIKKRNKHFYKNDKDNNILINSFDVPYKAKERKSSDHRMTKKLSKFFYSLNFYKKGSEQENNIIGYERFNVLKCGYNKSEGNIITTDLNDDNVFDDQREDDMVNDDIYKSYENNNNNNNNNNFDDSNNIKSDDINKDYNNSSNNETVNKNEKINKKRYYKFMSWNNTKEIRSFDLKKYNIHNEDKNEERPQYFQSAFYSSIKKVSENTNHINIKINKELVNALSVEEILNVLDKYYNYSNYKNIKKKKKKPIFNEVNIVTAYHRIAKHVRNKSFYKRNSFDEGEYSINSCFDTITSSLFENYSNVDDSPRVFDLSSKKDEMELATNEDNIDDKKIHIDDKKIHIDDNKIHIDDKKIRIDDNKIHIDNDDNQKHIDDDDDNQKHINDDDDDDNQKHINDDDNQKHINDDDNTYVHDANVHSEKTKNNNEENKYKDLLSSSHINLYEKVETYRNIYELLKDNLSINNNNNNNNNNCDESVITKHVANIAWASSVLSNNDPDIWKYVKKQFYKNINNFKAQEISIIIWSFGSIKNELIETEEEFHLLFNCIKKYINENKFKAQEFSNIIWSLAVCNYYNYDMLILLYNYAIKIFDKLLLKDISTILYSLSLFSSDCINNNILDVIKKNHFFKYNIKDDYLTINKTEENNDHTNKLNLENIKPNDIKDDHNTINNIQEKFNTIVNNNINHKKYVTYLLFQNFLTYSLNKIENEKDKMNMRNWSNIFWSCANIGLGLYNDMYKDHKGLQYYIFHINKKDNYNINEKGDNDTYNDDINEKGDNDNYSDNINEKGHNDIYNDDINNNKDGNLPYNNPFKYVNTNNDYKNKSMIQYNYHQNDNNKININKNIICYYKDNDGIYHLHGYTNNCDISPSNNNNNNNIFYEEDKNMNINVDDYSCDSKPYVHIIHGEYVFPLKYFYDEKKYKNQFSMQLNKVGIDTDLDIYNDNIKTKNKFNNIKDDITYNQNDKNDKTDKNDKNDKNDHNNNNNNNNNVSGQDLNIVNHNIKNTLNNNHLNIDHTNYSLFLNEISDKKINLYNNTNNNAVILKLLYMFESQIKDKILKWTKCDTQSIANILWSLSILNVFSKNIFEDGLYECNKRFIKCGKKKNTTKVKNFISQLHQSQLYQAAFSYCLYLLNNEKHIDKLLKNKENYKNDIIINNDIKKKIHAIFEKYFKVSINTLNIWKKQLARNQRKEQKNHISSSVHKKISNDLRRLNIFHYNEFFILDSILVDIFIPHSKIVIEIDGPNHFFQKGEMIIYKANTLFKKRLLRALGYTVISVPISDYTFMFSALDTMHFTKKLLDKVNYSP
ncbi:putative RAP protein [Plasmodium gaboni]|uniref:Putative RAP protein n=1 Tax=Plasmodium gaboni TaxID=647221 RepID=A0A151LT58_9APIC|nr:putative RAP protein [Plasmodium gaboni]KYO02376.1 putative RAP protein [Plasmodium gaboni]